MENSSGEDQTPSEECLRSLEEADKLLGHPPSLAESGYLQKSSVDHVEAVLGSSVDYELNVVYPKLRLAGIMAELNSSVSRPTPYAQLAIEGLRKAICHCAVDEGSGGVFSCCLDTSFDTTPWLRRQECANQDKRKPFLHIRSDGEVLQTTVKANRKDPIAIQIATRWHLPSRRGSPDASWKKVFWQEIVATDEMHFTLEAATYLVNRMDTVLDPGIAHPESTSLAHPRSLPTIWETEPDTNIVLPTGASDATDDALLAVNRATEQSQAPQDCEGFLDFEEGVKGLMGAVVKNNIHRLRIWITGIDAQLEGIPRPRMVEEAFSLMKSLNDVAGLQDVLDPTPTDSNARAFLAGTRVVEGDFDHVFEHVLKKASAPGGKVWQFVSSESELRAKRRIKGIKPDSEIILLYKLTVTFKVDSAVVSLDVERSGPMVIKQMEKFDGGRRHNQADDTAGTCDAEASSIHTCYSEVESRYWETFTAQASQTSSNNSLPGRSISSMSKDMEAPLPS